MIKGDDKTDELVKIISKVIKSRIFATSNIFGKEQSDDLMDQRWKSRIGVTNQTWGIRY